MQPIPITATWETVGFNPKWSWPYAAAGTMAASTIYNGATGASLATLAAYFAGWYNATTIMVLNDIAGGQKRTHLTAAGASTVYTDRPDTVIGAVASASQWASNVSGTIRVNGEVVIADSRYLGIALSGNWLWHSSNEGSSGEPEWQRWRAKIYQNRVLQRTVRHRVPAHGRYLTADGQLAYGDTARTFINKPNNTDVEVTATTPAVEFCPILVTGAPGETWCWSVAGGTAEYLVIRRAGAAGGWVYQLPWGASAIDAYYLNGAWKLLWNNSVGRMGMATITLSEAQAVTLPAPYPFTALVPAPAGSTGAGSSGGTSAPQEPPPIQFAIADPQTGMLTPPWVRWFQRFVNENPAMAGVGTVAADLLPAGPSATILGRDVNDDPTEWTLGDGLVVLARELAVAPSDFVQYDTRANQPDAADVAIGTLYGVTDESVVERSNGTTWDPFATW